MHRKLWSEIIVHVQLGVYLLLVPVLYLMPLDSIYHGHSICLFTNLFGVECLGCGMTRAVFSLMYFRFEDAWHYNKLVYVVAPILAYLYLKQIFILWQKVRKLHQ